MKNLFHRLSKASAAITLITGLFLYSSCTKDSGPIIVAPVNAPPISFGTDIQPILTLNCAITSCHNSITHKANLDLSAGTAYSKLVNVVSQNYAPVVRIKPFDADSSVVWDKINNLGVYGGIMPPAGSLGATDLDLIKKWIDQGAQNN